MTNRELLALETKRKLLDIGKRIIAEKGFNNTSVEDITNACGVAKGTFYTYFKKKEEIVSGIMYEQFDKIQEDVLNMQDKNIIEKISYYLNEFMKMVELYGIQISRQWIINNIDPTNELADTSNNTTKFEYDISSLKKILSDAIENNELKQDTPVELIANYLNTELYGMMLCWCMSDGKFEPLDWINEFSKLNLENIFNKYLVK